MAEAVVDSFSGRRDTEVTSTFMSCSRLKCFSAPAGGRVSGAWARAGVTRWNKPNARQAEAVERARGAVGPGTVTRLNRLSGTGVSHAMGFLARCDAKSPEGNIVR